MRSNRFPRPVLWAATLLVILVACSPGGSSGRSGGTAGAAVVRVPQDTGSLQEALDRVRPGGLVLVSPGVYRESVTVSKPRVVLRGTERSTVVVDGEFERSNGITVTGAGAVVENLTVRNHLANGVLFTGVTDERLQAGGAGGAGYDPLDTVKFPPLKGFRASYVTAYDNALYGIYAFDARSGVIEHSYASGHADSGIYVGQCRPCATVVRHNTVEHNAVGLEVTNASEQLYLLGNRAAHNRVGLTLNSNDLEALGPQHGAVVAGNALTDNNDDQSPEQADGGFGIGIGAGGGHGNLIERNLVSGNRAAGVLLTDVQGYPAHGNRVRGNRVTGNGTDLVLATGAPAGNCFTDNGESVTSPADLSGLARCSRATGTETPVSAEPGTGHPPLGRAHPVQAPPGISFQDVPAPPAQPNLPGSPTAAPRPAVALPGRVQPSDFPLPKSAEAVPARD
ncbi:right-handed parallel beta-helix repeat-containing protein [Streptomyces sp. S.PB5]|uniref:right-handed parallel beta-helix repeat-containing protein n=1 Tax=Streptomyces sp. S.PB5 TaxID=3020844 RepID=UPI0025B033BE|nr:right-handed parallel beta-helix repeat-containing protein [Streptomyces sp. S.PB5]MDN3020284.1 right-handed parallel beta-helix repeat-containing protein [Streptomyces sp. S.PB5]